VAVGQKKVNGCVASSPNERRGAIDKIVKKAGWQGAPLARKRMPLDA
jgi:hypothetical protein